LKALKRGETLDEDQDGQTQFRLCLKHPIPSPGKGKTYVAGPTCHSFEGQSLDLDLGTQPDVKIVQHIKTLISHCISLT
jgi:hypothetical protein